MSSEPHKYMTVPEKIELSGSGAMGYPTNQQPADHKYKPMKIPDTIMLDTSEPSVLSGGHGMSGHMGSGERDLLGEAKRTEEYRQLQPKAEGEKVIPHKPSERFEPPSSTHHLAATPASGTTGPSSSSSSSSDLERRVATLETKLERLTETFLSSQQNPRAVSGAESAIGGSRFWYVVTFAGWMMVPLIVVCMYQFKNK